MSPPTERAGAFAPAPPKSASSATDQSSQLDRVLRLLIHQEWICAVEFLRLSPPIVRYGARIYQLRKTGYVIWRRDCENRSHDHQTRQYEWGLIAIPESAL
jgi:hypothetical protein